MVGTSSFVATGSNGTASDEILPFLSSGAQLQKQLARVVFVGATGEVVFDGEKRSRENVEVQLLNVQGSEFIEVGSYRKQSGLQLSTRMSVRWPQNLTTILPWTTAVDG